MYMCRLSVMGFCIFVFPGKKGYEVLAQGGVIDNLAKHLVEHYGIPKRYIEVLDKTRK